MLGSTEADICNIPPFVVIAAAPPEPDTVIICTGIGVAAGAGVGGGVGVGAGVGAGVGVAMTLIVITLSPKTFEPSCAVALAVTVPLLAAVNRPAELMLAVPVPGITDHVTALLAAFAGKTSADI
ncbi:MAG: hypothetical protein FWE00_06645 [Defluviitaleaceae bacterium]|nr:hypothetical protein [Defluviitaleaceae bacterium]